MKKNLLHIKSQRLVRFHLLTIALVMFLTRGEAQTEAVPSPVIATTPQQKQVSIAVNTNSTPPVIAKQGTVPGYDSRGGNFDLVAANSTAAIGLSGLPTTEGVELNWNSTMEQNIRQFDVEYSTDGHLYLSVGSLPSRNLSSGAKYTYTDPVSFQGDVSYRIKLVSFNGNFSYSPVINVKSIATRKLPLVTPSIIRNGVIQINLRQGDAFKYVQIISYNGVIYSQTDIDGRTSMVSIPAGQLRTGIYLVNLVGERNHVVQKIMVQ